MFKKKLPKISVIIPVLNGEKTLEKAICSVIDQNYANLELIILDAGSNDATIDIIKRYQTYIDYWHSQPDGSPYLAINFGAKKATGDLIAQLMADDWFEPKTFHLIGNTFAENPHTDILSCGGRIVYYDEHSKQLKPRFVYIRDEQLALNFHTICFAIPAMSSRFLKKSFVEKIGLFNPMDANDEPIFSADREFLLRSVTCGGKNLVINHLGHTYFAHMNSATFSKKRATQLRIYQEHLSIAETYLQRDDLSEKQESILRYWYSDQSIRFLIYKLLELDFNSAWETAKNGIKKFKWYWPIALMMVPPKIAVKKVSERLRNIIMKVCVIPHMLRGLVYKHGIYK